jgi:hypothetical protein
MKCSRAFYCNEYCTWTGKYKALARDYSLLVAWYWAVGKYLCHVFTAIHVGGVKLVALLEQMI